MSSNAKLRRTARPDTPTDFKPNTVRDIWGALNILLADMFALYVKTKNFHWHVSGPHFRDYHRLLDEQADQISPPRTPLRNVFARPAVLRCVQSGTSAGFAARARQRRGVRHAAGHAGRTARRQQAIGGKFARDPTIFATSMAILPLRACWKTGSMKLNGAHGFYSRRRGRSPSDLRRSVGSLTSDGSTAGTRFPLAIITTCRILARYSPPALAERRKINSGRSIPSAPSLAGAKLIATSLLPSGIRNGVPSTEFGCVGGGEATSFDLSPLPVQRSFDGRDEAPEFTNVPYAPASRTLQKRTHTRTHAVAIRSHWKNITYFRRRNPACWEGEQHYDGRYAQPDFGDCFSASLKALAQRRH